MGRSSTPERAITDYGPDKIVELLHWHGTRDGTPPESVEDFTWSGPLPTQGSDDWHDRPISRVT